MMVIWYVGVVDIGKINLKVVVVDFESESEIGVLICFNCVVVGLFYFYFDFNGYWDFIC